MSNELDDQLGSRRIQSHVEHTTLPDPSVESNPASANQSDKSRRLNLRNARRLSRVFADFSLLDPFASRKSVDHRETSRSQPNSILSRLATSYGHTHATSSGGYFLDSFGPRPLRPTSPTPSLPSSVPPISALATSVSDHRTKPFSSPMILDTPSTPQIKSSTTLLPENIPLSLGCCDPSHNMVSVKRRTQSLELDQLPGNIEVTSMAPLSARSRSLRIIPISNLSRPTTPKTPTPCPDIPIDTRDPPLPPEAVRQHFLEVKRARKMTQLFGQELPQDLLRTLDGRKTADHVRRRADSDASSHTVESHISTPTLEKFDDDLEGETVLYTSQLTESRVDFQERRRRVVKLSQFFGVDHAEIVSSVVCTKSNHRHATSCDGRLQDQVPVSRGEPVEVGVKVVSRRRWGLGESMRDVELSDAINQLRCLKAN